jgi:hypothetical protein
VMRDSVWDKRIMVLEAGGTGESLSSYCIH